KRELCVLLSGAVLCERRLIRLPLGRPLFPVRGKLCVVAVMARAASSAAGPHRAARGFFLRLLSRLSKGEHARTAGYVIRRNDVLRKNEDRRKADREKNGRGENRSC